jgi:toxin ParE1/3/4
MTLYRLTPAAQRDLSDIWDYTEQQWGVVQAEAYVEDIRSAVERVAAHPERGRARDEVREGYRSFAVGRHAIFYIARDRGVDVIRILHQRMDVGRHL